MCYGVRVRLFLGMLSASALLGVISVGAGATSYFSAKHAENLRTAQREGNYVRGAISSSNVQIVNDNGVEYRVVGTCSKSSEILENKTEVVLDGNQVISSTRTRRTELVDSTKRRFYGDLFLRSDDKGEETFIDPSLYSKIPMQTLVSRYSPVGGREHIINQVTDHSGGDEAGSGSNRVLREKERVMGAKTEVDGCLEGGLYTVVGNKVQVKGRYGPALRIQAGVISVVSPLPLEQLISEAQSTADTSKLVSIASAGLSAVSHLLGVPGLGSK